MFSFVGRWDPATGPILHCATQWHNWELIIMLAPYENKNTMVTLCWVSLRALAAVISHLKHTNLLLWLSPIPIRLLWDWSQSMETISGQDILNDPENVG